MGADRRAKCYILQRDDAGQAFEARHFDPQHWVDKPGYQEIDGGRGGSIRLCTGQSNAILRRYYRGGMVRKLLTDKYLWTGKTRTRPWREWAIMNLAREAGLPVPEVLAACAFRKGLWYRAAIITRYLEDTETLAERLSKTPLSSKNWYQLGLVIKNLQQQRIRHADLNASNILVDRQEKFYLIDFDRARLVKCLDDWQWRPLHRLQGSLEKFYRNRQINYDSDDWQSLMDGYQS